VAYIDAHKAEFGIEPICRVLRDAGVQIASSTYYAARNRSPSARSVSDAATTEVIRKVHADNYGVYGVTKVHAELRRAGHRVARCTVHFADEGGRIARDQQGQGSAHHGGR
jgi:putative transposase